ncbi:glycohydrolase toxin TNT-related protein [Mycolicibacterium celeriflavum]|uniref:TNT domain-containing protein n=1 Tax=Mycolicibacterium celeriflavum TaxID=1249101 RepID=UPI003CEDD818
MALNLGELKQWPPEIADLAQAAREAANNHTVSGEFYRSLIAVSSWEGQGAEAAKSAMTATAADHEAVADHVGGAASRMENVHRDAEALAETIKRILDDAAAQPAVGIDESTNQVIPPDTSHMTDEYAAQVAAKVTDLRGRIADALADGERIDTELAGAITTASGERVVKTAGSLEEMLLPATDGRRGEPKPDEQSSTPKNLDEALDRIAEPGRPAPPVPLDPAKVEEFKSLARETMLRSGVPPEQIEQRLDAMVAAAQKPLPTYKPSERDATPPPKPSFEDGFADGWFGTEESIKNLIGANGLEDLKESWTDLAKGAWHRVTNPIDSMKEDLEHLTKYPGHYLGEVAGSTALTAPSAMFGGEAALGARAVIPDDVIDMPSHTGTVEQSTPLGPVAADHPGSLTPDIPAAKPLPPDSPLFDGYDPIPPGPQFTNADGSLIYPDEDLESKPYAVPGTVIPEAQLPAGTELGRFGSPFGAYLAPEGTPFAELSLPVESAAKPYYRYVVDDPTALPPGWSLEQSQVAPWFHQPGGGTQYRIIAPPGERATTQALVDSGFLKEIG